MFFSSYCLAYIFSFAHILIGYGVGIGSDLIGDSVGYSEGEHILLKL